MIIGDLLLVMNNETYYGPPLSRATAKAVFSVQVTNVVGGPTVSLTVDIQTRNREDTSWSSAGTLPAITASGDVSKAVSGLKELVRYAYTFTAGSAGDGMYVISAAPQWLND